MITRDRRTGRNQTDALVTTAPVSRRARRAFAELRHKSINFEPVDFDDARSSPEWNTDEQRRILTTEPPGDPYPGGPFESGRNALIRYGFADPSIVRAVYDAQAAFDGRDMLLVGRFLWLRFFMGVRVGGVVEERTVVEGHPVQRFAWHYRTLEDHLEQGQMNYELRKNMVTGEIELLIRAYSRRGPIDNRLVRLGFKLFGRREQLRFYQRVLDRMQSIARRAPGACAQGRA